MKIIDIIIPYLNMPEERIEQLYNTLNSQSIIDKCTIYLISDNSPDAEKVIKKFTKSHLDVVFLYNETRLGPGVTRNKGIDNSSNDYIFFLDADDYFVYHTALEDLYNQMFFKKLNSLFYKIYMDINTKHQFFKPAVMVKRNFIYQYKIKFPEYYMGETQVFQTKIKLLDINNFEIDGEYVFYGLKDNNNHLLQEILDTSGGFVFNYCNIIPYLTLFNFFEQEKIKNQDFLNFLITNFYEFYKCEAYHKTLSLYCLYYIYQHYSDSFNENLIDMGLIVNFSMHHLSYTSKNNILTGEEEFKNYFCQLYSPYIDNRFMSPVINEMSKILNIKI